jgi:uncharacterized RDD family membrane protein YckC
MKVFTAALMAAALMLAAPAHAGPQSIDVSIDDIQFHNPAIRIGQGFDLKAGDGTREVLVIGGDARIAGRVERDVVVILGKAQIESTAVIEGSLVVIGGTVATADGARVDHDLFIIGGFEGSPAFTPGGNHVVIGTSAMGAWFRGIVPWLTHGLLLARPIVPWLPWVWVAAGIFFLVNLLLNVVFDVPVRAITITLRATPLSTFMTGLLVMLLLGPVCFLLAVSVVGIAVIPFLLCALLIAAVLGRIAFARWIGTSVVRQEDDSSRAASFRSFAIGSAIMCIAYMIPVLGLITWAMAGIFGLGAATLAFFSAYRRENPKKPKEPKVAKDTKDTKEPREPNEPVLAPAAPMAFSQVEPPLAVALPNGGALPMEGAVPHEGGSHATALIAMPRARFIERLAAFTLDFILIVLVAQMLRLDPGHDAPLGRLGIILAIAYHVGFWTWKGTTLGGIICQLRVVRTDGGPLHFAESLVRGLTGIFSLVVVGLGFLWVLRDPESQAWHDRVAGTYVVKVPRTYPI